MRLQKQVQQCATCNYWGGRRETELGGTICAVDLNEKGKCQMPASGFKGFDMNAHGGVGCQDWAAWFLLK
jgi:hypothetical protein